MFQDKPLEQKLQNTKFCDRGRMKLKFRGSWMWNQLCRAVGSSTSITRIISMELVIHFKS